MRSSRNTYLALILIILFSLAFLTFNLVLFKLNAVTNYPDEIHTDPSFKANEKNTYWFTRQKLTTIRTFCQGRRILMVIDAFRYDFVFEAYPKPIRMPFLNVCLLREKKAIPFKLNARPLSLSHEWKYGFVQPICSLI